MMNVTYDDLRLAPAASAAAAISAALLIGPLGATAAWAQEASAAVRNPDGGDPSLIAGKVVVVSAVVPGPKAAPVTFSGVVRAARRADLGFTIGGRMVARPAQVGQRVRKNDELARLDLAPLRNSVAAAKAQLEDVEARLAQLERDVERERRLVKKGAGRPETLEKLISGLAGTRAERARARAGYAEAKRQLKEARLRAPFDGTVIEVMLEAGEFARPGVAVVVLSAEDQLEVEARVPEIIRSRLRRDAAVQVRLPLAGGHRLAGRVSQLGRGASGPGQLFPVVVALPKSDRIAPGYTAEVVFEVATPDEVMIPAAAVADPGGRAPFVFRVRDGFAEKVSVQVLRLVGNQVTVKSTLKVGDEVVIKGHIALLAGDSVEVQR